MADQPALLRLLGLTLRDTFGSVHLAASAEAAFVRLDEADFDIAVLDLRPGGEYTGWELARAVHTRRPNLALVVTAWVDEAAPTNPAQAGVTAVLFKPYSGSELRRVITELCQRQAPA